MKIDSLALHNFGIYSGTNEIKLSNKKPVVLIGGMNGRGKTTLLEAILLALYGKRSFSFLSKNLSFPKYLSSLVNTSDNTQKTYIELDFCLTTDEQEDHYRVKRSWSLNHAVPALRTIAFKNNFYDPILSDNWDAFIEELLPSTLASFFFFDGEKISDMANANDEDIIKNSIRDLLGITIIDKAVFDIKKIMDNKKNIIKADSYSSRINKFEEEILSAENELKGIISNLGLLNIKKNKLSDKLRKAENEFESIDSKLISDRDKIIERKSKLEEDFSSINSRILNLIAGDIPLIMVSPLLNDILAASDEERKQRLINAAFEGLPDLYKNFDKKGEHRTVFEDFIKFVEKNTKEVAVPYNLTENGFSRLNSLCTSKLNFQVDSLIDLVKQQSDLSVQIATLDNYLSIDTDENIYKKKYRTVLELTSKLAAMEEQYRITQMSVDSKKADLDLLRHKKLKIIEEAVLGMENATDDKRIFTYAGYSIDILQAYKKRIQEAKTQELASVMSVCFKRIASKQSLIKTMKIDPVLLDFSYLNSDGNFVDRSSLSAGEKQLLVIAMLWGLAICSKKTFPVIIDTPLARLDSAHREALITNYFPRASKQTILLSTDSEINGKYYDLLYPYVDKEYILIYDDTTKSSTIHRGYFGAED